VKTIATLFEVEYQYYYDGRPNRRETKMKQRFLAVLSIVVILTTLLTSCTNDTNYTQKYIENARMILDDNQLDGEVRMDYDRQFEGYDVYNLIVTSEKYSDISDSQKKQVLQKFSAMYVDGAKMLVLAKVNSHGNIFSLDYENNLERDGEIYPPLPTSKPFVMPTGDFEMSWDTYSSEYNSLGGILTIRRQGSKYTQKLVMSDGSSDISDLTVLSDGDEIRLTDRPGNSFGDYMYISSTGYLYFCDSQGVIYTVPLLNK
jgi:hypothetical protein